MEKIDRDIDDHMNRTMPEEPGSTVAWLVEWPPDEDQPVRWWHPKHGWTIHANRAIRFSREVDATDYIAAIKMPWCKAIEHKWLD
jgi:hypothetical protein